MIEIYLIRHGETDWNVARRLQGSTDIPLNENGIKLAEVTAKGMADIEFDYIFTSPLQRAKTTALIIKGNRDIPIIEDARLKEISFGIYEGLCCSKENYTIPDPDFLKFFKAPNEYVPPEGGESIKELCDRTTSLLRDIVNNPEYENKKILLSAHGATVKALLSSFTIKDFSEFWNGGVHQNCGLSLVTCKDGQFHLEWENKTFYEAEVIRGYYEE